MAGALAAAGIAATRLVHGTAVPGPPPASLGLVENRPVPSSVTHLPLFDEHGRATSLSTVRGRVVVLADFLTSCQEACPMTTGALLELQRAVNADGLSRKVVLVEASVDPGRDNPARLAAYAAMTGATWPLLTGSHPALDALWHFFGVYHAVVPEASPPGIDWQTGRPYTYDVAHTDGFVLLGPHLHERFFTGGLADVGGKLPVDLARLLDAAGRKNLAHPGHGAWTVPDAARAIGWLLGRSVPLASSPGA